MLCDAVVVWDKVTVFIILNVSDIHTSIWEKYPPIAEKSIFLENHEKVCKSAWKSVLFEGDSSPAWSDSADLQIRAGS